jgi:ergothioneine biosynthesis protein EgtB
MAFAENYKPLSEVSDLSEKLQAAWARSDQLFDIVKRQAMLSKPIAFRHPFIFYVGHLPAFAWNQICAGVLKWTSPNSRFDEIFSRGIDPDVDSGSCHAHPDVPENWPSLDAVLRYRDQVRSAVLNSFDSVYARGSADVMAENGRVFTMVLEHEYMHQETLLYMIHALSEELKIRSREFRGYYFHGAAARKKITVPRGRAQLGARFDELAFGWDNEFPSLSVEVPEFAIDSVPVTNQEFFEFVLAGGYDQARFWQPADWLWRHDGGIGYPHFWLKQDGEWFYRAVFDLLPLKQVGSWPVYVSLAEARAFANWRGARLPTEAEFQRAAYANPAKDASTGRDYFPRIANRNIGFRNWSPVPVGFYSESADFWGVRELIGNGWEWTQSEFRAFPGFTPYMTHYQEYSADFFDGKHFVLKGGSWATDADLVRPSFRNWYQAHYPYVFAKFRCVEK